MKKCFISLIIAFLMALCALLLISCSKGSNIESTGTDATASTSADTAVVDPLAQRTAISDDLPGDDLDGYLFTVFTMDTVRDCFYSESLDGEVVNDTICNTVRVVEERFNCDITTVSSGTDDNAHANQIKSAVLAGDNAYQLMTCHDALAGNLSMSGLFANFYDIPYLNFEKPWWHEVDRLTVLGQCYLAISDLSYNSLSRTWTIFVNRDKMTDYNLEIPYSAVQNGTWTLDMLIKMTKNVYEDLNGNSVSDKNADFYGFAIEPECYGLLESFGLETTQKDDTDILNINFDKNKMSSLVEKVYSWLFESTGAYSTMVGNGWPTEEFRTGRLLFARSWMSDAVTAFRMENDLNYGILPIPKYDEAQESYVQITYPYPILVPSTAQNDFNNIGLIVEAWSAQGYKEVYPAYYEIALKQKYTQDSESMIMLEIINDNKCMSFSWVYENWQGFNRTLNAMVTGKTSDFASYYAKFLPSAEKRVEILIEAFKEMSQN